MQRKQNYEFLWVLNLKIKTTKTKRQHNSFRLNWMSKRDNYEKSLFIIKKKKQKSNTLLVDTLYTHKHTNNKSNRGKYVLRSHDNFSPSFLLRLISCFHFFSIMFFSPIDFSFSLFSNNNNNMWFSFLFLIPLLRLFWTLW